jgi:hypothetical protein
MFHAESRRTNMTPIVAFRNFANAPEKHSFPHARRLKCFNAFVINVLAMCNTNHQEKNIFKFLHSRIMSV